jgi:hypothetical protein
VEEHVASAAVRAFHLQNAQEIVRPFFLHDLQMYKIPQVLKIRMSRSFWRCGLAEAGVPEKRK